MDRAVEPPERSMAVYIDGLVSMGYFDNGAKVGLIEFDAAPFQRMAAAMKARLAYHHLSLTDEQTTTEKAKGDD